MIAPKTEIDITKPRYERLGECRQCGTCCLGENCEHLTWRNGKAVCVVHDQTPRKCWEFPANPPIVFKGCGYLFRDTWTGRILKPGEL